MGGIQTTESQVLAELRTRILRGTYPIGARLRQADIATDLGVSTTPVREALRDLAAEGLVQIDTNRGAVVRELTKDELSEVLELQLVLEVECLIRAVPRYTAADVEAARDVHEAIRRAAGPLEFAILNHDFHMVLSRPSERPRSLDILSGLMNVAMIQLSEDIATWDGRRAVGEADHAEMVEAAAARDLPLMLDVIRRHTGAAIQHLRDSFE
ncbi:GntR family transcriptional regulator [Microbacterium enclense]|uniref:GntR family transcriptional regulator n=1 Tax=Microbacterium enclense TaxID=993073 RepID=UPI003D73E2FB